MLINHITYVTFNQNFKMCTSNRTFNMKCVMLKKQVLIDGELLSFGNNNKKKNRKQSQVANSRLVVQKIDFTVSDRSKR